MTTNFLTRFRLLAVICAASLALSAPSVLAQKLALPELPTGCQYTENRSQPLASHVSIDALSAVYSDLGDAAHPIASVGVQCSGVLSGDVIVGLKAPGGLAWTGPAQDVLRTETRGVGVRLFAETQSQGAACRSQGTISAANDAECRIRGVDEGERSFNFVIKAQLVKTEKSTPVKSNKMLRIAHGGALNLYIQGVTSSSLDILNSGLIAPNLTTAAVCTLQTESNQRVNFGRVHRPDSRQEKTLGQPQATPILVSCIPERDDTTGYEVSIAFTAGKAMPGDDTMLGTDINDLAIRFTDAVDGNNWLRFGEKLIMPYRPNANIDGASVFSNIYYWHLRYLPAADHSQNGQLNALATYTIEVQ